MAEYAEAAKKTAPVDSIMSAAEESYRDSVNASAIRAIVEQRRYQFWKDLREVASCL